jgi:hypothetical protein
VKRVTELKHYNPLLTPVSSNEHMRIRWMPDEGVKKEDRNEGFRLWYFLGDTGTE